MEHITPRWPLVVITFLGLLQNGIFLLIFASTDIYWRRTFFFNNSAATFNEKNSLHNCVAITKDYNVPTGKWHIPLTPFFRKRLWTWGSSRIKRVSRSKTTATKHPRDDAWALVDAPSTLNDLDIRWNTQFKKTGSLSCMLMISFA